MARKSWHLSEQSGLKTVLQRLFVRLPVLRKVSALSPSRRHDLTKERSTLFDLTCRPTRPGHLVNSASLRHRQEINRHESDIARQALRCMGPHDRISLKLIFYILFVLLVFPCTARTNEIPSQPVTNQLTNQSAQQRHGNCRTRESSSGLL